MFPLAIDTAKSKFQILDDNHLTLNEAVKQDKNEMKDQLRARWKEVRGIQRDG